MVSTEILAADATSSEFNASHSRGVLAVCIVTIVFSGLFYAARIASRRMTKQALDLSDHILLFGMLCTWIISATTIWGSSSAFFFAYFIPSKTELRGEKIRYHTRSWAAFGEAGGYKPRRDLKRHEGTYTYTL